MGDNHLFGGEYIRSIALMGFHEAIERHGMDSIKLLNDAQLADVLRVEHDLFHETIQVTKCLQYFVAKNNKETVALEWAHSLAPYFPNLGAAAYLSAHHETCEDWLIEAISYLSTQANTDSLELLRSSSKEGKIELPTLRFKDIAPDCKTISLLYIASIKLLLDNLSASQTTLIEQVNFKYKKPESLELLQETFGENIQFECEHNELIFKQNALKTKIAKEDHSEAKIIDEYITARMRLHPNKRRMSMQTTLQIALSSVLGARKNTLDSMASALNVSQKKLQRLLADEGTSFSNILEEVRENSARNLLANTRIPIRRIAHMLDYSSSPPFTLACRRWTNMSPKQFRDQHKKTA